MRYLQIIESLVSRQFIWKEFINWEELNGINSKLCIDGFSESISKAF